MAVQAEVILQGLDRMVEKYHLLKHPFYRAWANGTLSREMLQVYAAQYYQHVREFPDNLRNLASRTNGPLRNLVVENLAEELDEVNPHPGMWREFAGALGVSDQALDSSRLLPGIAALLDTFEELSKNGSYPQAVAAFYVYEAQVPEIAGKKSEGLKKYYGVTSEKALRYFAVHEEADVRHRAAWRQWLAGQSEGDLLMALPAGERALKALWGALDAVYSQQTCSARN